MRPAGRAAIVRRQCTVAPRNIFGNCSRSSGSPAHRRAAQRLDERPRIDGGLPGELLRLVGPFGVGTRAQHFGLELLDTRA